MDDQKKNKKKNMDEYDTQSVIPFFGVMIGAANSSRSRNHIHVYNHNTGVTTGRHLQTDGSPFQPSFGQCDKLIDFFSHSLLRTDRAAAAATAPDRRGGGKQLFFRFVAVAHRVPVPVFHHGLDEFVFFQHHVVHVGVLSSFGFDGTQQKQFGFLHGQWLVNARVARRVGDQLAQFRGVDETIVV